jgi:phosphatidylglycerophosphate synthase
MVIMIMARDFLVMALRVKLAAEKLILTAIPVAKIKTTFEYLVVFFVLSSLAGKELGVQFWRAEMVSFALMTGAVILALVSGIQYWFEYRRDLA